MFYYKDLLKTLTNSTILNLAYQSIQGLNNHSQTQEQDGSSSGVSSDEASISSGSSISATTALTESISIDDSDDQDEDDPMDHVPDPNLYVNYNDRVFIYKNDLKCLQPEKWLNDSIMEYCYTEMHRAALAADRNKASNIHISNSFFYTRMQNAKTNNMDIYQAARKWLKDVDLFEKKIWLIPVCEAYHWYLIAVTNPKYCISQGFPRKKCRVFLLDSLGTVPISRLNLVAEFLRAAVNVQGLEFNKPHRSRLQVPQQSNYSDCGLYVLFFIQTLLYKQNRLLNATSDTLKETTWNKRNLPTRKSILASLRLQRL